MRVGVIFPQTELPPDLVALRDYLQAVEGIGYAHLLVYDHVLGADPTDRPDWRSVYTHESAFLEPLTLFGYAAAVTHRLELATGVLVLSQRQTALVAKQAAEIDVLSGGRLRLGVGVGWNDVEFQALNARFRDRGARIVEQVAVLRALWTHPLVSFQGRWHRIDAAGLNPRPIQQPIPIWMGGWDERVLRRVGEIADGWIPLRRPLDGWRAAIERIRGHARAAGRDPSTIGIDGRASLKGTPDEWRQTFDEWRALGATHLSVNTIGFGLRHPDEHIAAIRRWFEEVRPHDPG